MRPSLSSLAIWLAIWLHNMGSEAYSPVLVDSREGPVQRWLGNLTLSINMPPLTETFTILGIKNNVELDLNLLVCKGIQIGSISSSRNGSTLGVGMSGIGVTCTIPTFRADLDGHSIGSGSGTATISDSGLQEVMELTDEHGMATSAHQLSCHATITTKLKLELKALSNLVNLILKWAEGEIDRKISSLICQELDTLVNTNLTQALQMVDKDLEPLIPPNCCKPSPPPHIPDGMINWRDNSVIGLADFFLDSLIGVDGPLGINALVNQFTQNTGELKLLAFGPGAVAKIPIESLGAVVKLGLKTLDISGLNQFDSFHFLGPTANPYSLNTSISTRKLNITLGAYVEAITTSGTISGGNLTENFKINIALGNLAIQADTLLAMYENVTRNVEMGQLVEVGCLARAIHSVNFTNLVASFSIENLEIIAEGAGVESELDNAIDDILAVFLDSYDTIVPDVVRGLLMKPIRTRLNTELNLAIQNFSTTACNPPKPSSKEFIDWKNGTLNQTFSMVNKLMNVAGPLSINWVMKQILNADDSGTSRKQGEVFRIQVQSDLIVSVRDVDFAGVTSFFNFSVLNAIDHETLTSSIGFAERHHPLNLSLWFDFIIPGQPVDSIRLEVDISMLRLLATGVFQVRENDFAHLKLGQLSNVDCVATSMGKGAFTELDLNVEDFHIRIHGGHSDSLHRLEDNIPNFDKLSSELINFVFDLASPFVENIVNSYVDQKIYEGPYVCANEPVPSSDESSKDMIAGLKTTWFAMVVVISGFVAIGGISLFCYRRRKKSIGKSLTTSLNDASIYGMQTESMNAFDEDEKKSLTGEEQVIIEGSVITPPLHKTKTFPPWDCLAAHPNIPIICRFGVPLILAGNIACFIVANTTVGAGVVVKIRAGSIEDTLPSLFEFSLGNTIRDMWIAGVYPLSLLVAIFSGGWPYLKLMLMQACWLFPLGWLNKDRRESLLMVLDALGKWSMIDTFVLALMLVAFHFTITNPGTEIGTTFLDVRVIVQPDIGFYCFLLATIMSLITTHVVLHYHRFADGTMHLPPGGQSEALCSHRFKGSVYGLADDKRVRCSKLGNVVVTFLLVFTIAIILLGSFIESFKFEFKGLAGLFLGSQASTGYSLLSVTKAIPESAEDPNFIGVKWIQAVFYTITFAVPLAHMAALLVLWWTPLKIRAQYALFNLTEILNAWSALDVFVISIIAAILEIQQFAVFMVGDNCDAINEFIVENMSQYLSGYNVCFTVIATLSEGCWTLFAACLVSLVVSQTVMQSSHKAMYGRIEELSLEDNGKPLLDDETTKQRHGTGRCGETVANMLFRCGLLTVEEGVDERLLAGVAEKKTTPAPHI